MRLFESKLRHKHDMRKIENKISSLNEYNHTLYKDLRIKRTKMHTQRSGMRFFHTRLLFIVYLLASVFINISWGLSCQSSSSSSTAITTEFGTVFQKNYMIDYINFNVVLQKTVQQYHIGLPPAKYQTVSTICTR